MITPTMMSTFKAGSRKMMENRVKNLWVMKHISHPVNALVKRYCEVPTVIVAAGPSLTRDDLKLLDYFKGVVIACDSALGPMENADSLVPHYVTSVDYNDVTRKKFTENGIPSWSDGFNLISLVSGQAVARAFRNRLPPGVAFSSFGYAESLHVHLKVAETQEMYSVRAFDCFASRIELFRRFLELVNDFDARGGGRYALRSMV